MSSYYDKAGISQSFLKAVLKGITGINNYFKMGEKNYNLKENSALRLGSLLDCFLTTPDLEDDLYYVEDADFVKPSDSIINILTDCYENYDIDSMESTLFTESLYKELCIKHSYYAKDTKGNETNRNKVFKGELAKNCNKYFHFLKYGHGKSIVTAQEYDRVREKQNQLENHYFTSWFFKLLEHPDIKVIPQAEIFTKIDGVDCKGMMDWVLVNNSIKPIVLKQITIPARSILIVDLKLTSYPTEKFNSVVKKFRYDFQQSFYRRLISEAKNIPIERIQCMNIFASLKRDYTGFKVYTEKELYVGTFGVNGNEHVKGYKQAMDILKQYQEQQNQFTIDYEIFNNNGKVKEIEYD